MAGDYRVSIELAAKVSDYNRGMELATKATRRLQNAQQGVARTSSDAADGMTLAGAAARQSASGLSSMAKETLSLEKAQRKLNDTNAKATRSSSGGGRTRSSGVGLPSVGAVLPKPNDFKSAGAEAAKLFTSGLGGGLSTPIVGPIIAGILITAVAAAAPAAGAALGGGIIAGLGSAAIGAGVAASLRSPIIKGAVDDLQADFGKLADGIGEDFETEVKYSLNLLRGTVKEIGPDLRTALAPAASYLKPLTLGFEGLVKGALPGLTAGIADAAPIFDMLATELPAVGEAIGYLFETIGENSDEIASGLQFALFIVEDLVVAGADIISFLSGAYVATLDWGIALATVGQYLPFIGGMFTDFGAAMTELKDTANGLGAGGGMSSAINVVGEKLKYGADATEGMVLQQKILNGTMRDGIDAAGGLAAALDALNGVAVTAEEAQARYELGVLETNRAIKENAKEIKNKNERDAENTLLLTAQSALVSQNAAATYDRVLAKKGEAAAEIAATKAYQEGRTELVKSAIAAGMGEVAANRFVDSILKIPPTWSTKITVQTEEAIAQLEALGFKVTRLPDGSFKIDAKTKEAKSRMAEARAILDALNGRTATMRIYVESVAGKVKSAASNAMEQTKREIAAGKYRAKGGVTLPRQFGGVTAAAGGLLQPEIAPPGTRYQWAEPETGGELFLPRRGINKARGRDLLEVAASWYDGVFVPMAKGGFTAAASGLVNVGAPAATRGTGLDSQSAYIGARDAVVSLNKALKDNGRTLSLNTSKGRANRSELISGISAAKSAAEAKYAETGSVKAANIAYAEHLARLRRVLAQQKISASTISSLMKQLSVRPDYATAAPKNSLTNIAFAKSAASTIDQMGSLQDTLSLNLPTTSLNSASGRENLLGIIGFLESAAGAAQDRFSQTGSSKTAAALYKTYLAALQKSLADAGFSKAAATALISTYGRITLQPNALGGVYGSMGQAMALGPGQTLYGFREPSTGGEAFIPRNGERQRSERALQIASGWYGGQYQPPGGAGGGGGNTHTSHMTVNNYGEALTTAKLQQVQRGVDVKVRVGRPR